MAHGCWQNSVLAILPSTIKLSTSFMVCHGAIASEAQSDGHAKTSSAYGTLTIFFDFGLLGCKRLLF